MKEDNNLGVETYRKNTSLVNSQNSGLQKADPVRELAVKYRGYTPAKAFTSGGKSIYYLAKEQGELRVAAAFSLHLVALSRFLNLKNGLSESHIDYIVDKLLSDYKWMNLADFAIVIDRIKSAYYGDFYENFNATKFLDIMRKYDLERTEAIIRVRQKEAEEGPGISRQSRGYVQGLLNDMSAKAKEKRERRKAIEEERKREVDAAIEAVQKEHENKKHENHE